MVIDFIYDIILAYIFYLLIESPFTNMFALVVGAPTGAQRDSKAPVDRDMDMDLMNNNGKHNAISDNAQTKL